MLKSVIRQDPRMKQLFLNSSVFASRSFFTAVMLFLMLFLSGLSSHTVSAELLVLYPEIRAPFSKIFEDISAGAQEEFRGRTTLVSLDENEVALPIVKANRPDVILALGQRSVLSLELEKNQVPVVLGAVNDARYPFPGILMIPDSKVILEKLIMLSPAVKRVHVVKKTPGEDIQLRGASEFLASQGKELIIHQGADIREAAAIYAELTKHASAGDAVWILQDGSFVNSAILSMLLDVAWKKNLVVFSSNPLHVKHGALFAVYPDNRKMGASLANLANRMLTSDVDQTMSPLQDVLLAVNERTGNHLGLSLSSKLRDEVNLLLPAR